MREHDVHEDDSRGGWEALVDSINLFRFGIPKHGPGAADGRRRNPLGPVINSSPSRYSFNGTERSICVRVQQHTPSSPESNIIASLDEIGELADGIGMRQLCVQTTANNTL